MGSDYFPVHAHSEYSLLDGMGRVEDMVAKVAALNQPALALTDHGHMAGALRLYKECRKHDIAPFPGTELYVVTDVNDPLGKKERFHLGMMALNYKGYQAMLQLSSRSYTKDRFHMKPLVDLGDLADLSEHASEDIAVTTGCFFGMVQQALVNVGPEHATMLVKMLESWFPHTFVELQHHGIVQKDHNDDDVLDAMLDMAYALSLPVVFGQDSHYCDGEHQQAHDLMKDICYFGDNDDNRFPGGPYDLASTKELRGIFKKKEWDRIEEGHARLLELNILTIPALDTYKFHVPKVAKDADTKLRRMVNIALEELAQYDQYIPEHTTRANYELSVIKQMGLADYFLLAKEEVTDWCRDNGIIVNARGSANGSLICYLLGITKVDPIEWGTSFDRFLSVDRQKPPDIDFDIESRYRDLVVEHLRVKFPTLVGIGTYAKMGISERGEDEDGDDTGKGSVIVQYMAAKRNKLGKAFDGKVAKGDWDALNALAELPVRKSLGQHAGGYVLPTKEHPIDAYLATARITSSGNIVTQAVMEDVELAGYMKLDLLGLRSLETISGCARALGHDPNDWSWVPWDDPKACALLSSMNTDGVFQFEGFSTRKGGRTMGIRSTMDAIVCLALYRPALMDGGQTETYLENRKVAKKNRPYRLNKFFDPILDVTKGVPVFQEQIMEMCKSIGMPFREWNDLLTAVKASNDKIGEYAQGIMKRVHPVFIECCGNSGVPEDDAEDVWETILGFTEYGFNRAHATSYGHMAYRSAYLKAHYPLEYMQALLAAWAGTKKEQQYMRELRRMQIGVARPDVNLSDVVWVIDPKRKGALRKGLTTINGVGHKAAAAIIDARPDGGWDTMDDFIASVPAKTVSGGKDWAKHETLCGVMEKLRQAGALTSLGIDPV